MSRTSILSFALLLAAGMATSASATTLFENAADGGTLGGNSRFMANGTGDIGAEDFILGAASIVDAFSFGALLNDGADISGSSIGWSIRTDTAGLPGGTIVASGNDAASGSLLGDHAGNSVYDEYRFDVDIADIALSAATTYWLTLQVTFPSAGTVFWLHTGNGNNLTAVSSNGGSSWTSPYSTVGPNEVFSIEGSVAPVPLPASALLLLGGLSGLGLARRRQRRQD